MSIHKELVELMVVQAYNRILHSHLNNSVKLYLPTYKHIQNILCSNKTACLL